MNIYGKPRKRLTLWLGSDDGGEDGMNGHGYVVSREDSMVSVAWDGRSENDEDLEVFILPGLFPAIRRAMAAAEAAHGRPPAGEACDECGAEIPDADGGGLANRHHRPSCSLHDASAG